MEKLFELKERLTQERPAPWDALPDIALYMDQIVSYMPRQLIRYDDTEVLTSAMVNNYIKDGLLPRADGKRYDRTHLAHLTAICMLKQVLSVKEMKTLIQSGSEGNDVRQTYERFCRRLDDALNETAKELEEERGEEDLAWLALGLALRSYADKLACQRVLNLLQERESAPEGKKQNKTKEKGE